jgi:hypothetical protein
VQSLASDVDPTCQFPVQELQRRIDAITAAGTRLAAPADRGFVEHLTILTMLSTLGGAKELLHVTAALSALPPTALGPAETRVLAAGAAAFVAIRDVSSVDRLLPVLARLVRASAVDVPTELLAPICRASAEPGAAARLWPHVVAELLFRGGSDCPAEAIELLRRVEGEALDRCVKRLARLDDAQGDNVTLERLTGAAPELRRAVDLLLQQPDGDRIGERLLHDLRRRSPCWPGFEAVYLLRHYDDRGRQLVRHVLQAGDQLAAHGPLLELSAQIIIAELPALPVDRRAQPWLPFALMALGAQATPAAQRVLNAVLRRDWLLRAAWPPVCRNAARRALEECRSASRRRR